MRQLHILLSLFLIIFSGRIGLCANVNDWSCLLCETDGIHVFRKAIRDGKPHHVDVAVEKDSYDPSELKKDKKSSDRFLKNFIGAKKKSLSLVGIQDWQPRKIDWEDSPSSGRQVTLIGTYSNSRQERVYFKEIHFFQNGEVLRAVFSGPRSEDLNEMNLDIAKNLMDRKKARSE